MPVDGPGPDLCKVLTSAIAIGYPSPIIVNWGKDFHKGGGFGSSHLGKITGALEYLDGVTGESGHADDKLNDNDLVLIVDAYDIWFQLPPGVLLQRFHENNRKANERLAEQWNGNDVPMKQTIIVSTQKKCFPLPDAGSNLHCDALPDSPLPSDLYGPSTDMDPNVNPNGYHDIRPKFINSGSIMGPVGDMRKFLRQAKHKMDAGIANDVHLFSDQGIFGEVLGEQEVWRNWQRMLHRSRALPIGEEATTIQQNMEYHVGLDYYQNLFIPTVMEDDDGQFIRLSNRTTIAEYSSDLGISPVRLEGAPNDLSGVHNPLADVAKDRENLSWEEMPLYADFYTTAVPVIVHHNAHKDGRKERRTQWWDRTWYFPHLRALVTMQLQRTELQPLAMLDTENGSKVVYTAPISHTTKRRPRKFISPPGDKAEPIEEVDFRDVCRFEEEKEGQHWYDEVFRDNKGPL